MVPRIPNLEFSLLLQISAQHRRSRTNNFPIDTSQLIINKSKTSDINGAIIMRLSWWKISEIEIRETMYVVRSTIKESIFITETLIDIK